MKLKDAFWEHRHNLLKGSLWLLVIDTIGFIFPFLVKLVIDRLQGKSLPEWIPDFWAKLPTPAWILVICSLYVATAAFISYGRYWWRVLFIWSTFPIADKMRKVFFNRLTRLHLDFFKGTRVGDLISALSTDTENIRMLLAIGSLMFVDALLNFLLFPILLWKVDASLMLIVVPPLVAIAAMSVVWSDRLSNIYENLQQVTADLSAKAFEISSGIRIIKAFRQENSTHQNFVKKSEDLRDSSMKVARFQSFFVPGLDFALGLAMVLVLILGGMRVIRGEMALSNFVAFQLYLVNLDWPMMAMGWFIQMYRSGKASEKRVQDFLKISNPLKKETNQKRIPFDSHFDFRIENLSLWFSRPDRPVFEDLNFQIPSRQWIGLTGPVGCGKTMLLELLSRQRDPSKGNIFFRGENLKSLDFAEVSRDILYVPQETFLFSRSIRKNIHLGSVSEEEADLWKLLEDLNFDRNLLEERGGLETRLGERGVNLSGGQKQRISLGRALIRKRDVYLFDDLFSHVDAETEAKLIGVLKSRLPAKATVILVSQRLETLSQCSSVMVLKRGGLEFFGPMSEGFRKSHFLRELESIQPYEANLV